VGGRGHLVCLMNYISLCSVRCSVGQQGTPICQKKSSSVGVGIIEASISPLSASLANLEAGIFLQVQGCRPDRAHQIMNRCRPARWPALRRAWWRGSWLQMKKISVNQRRSASHSAAEVAVLTDSHLSTLQIHRI
jgi:hypothetical protein